MSTLLLVRHGQARAFSQSPDRLSQLGREQARQLAHYWIAVGAGFDAVYHGTLCRQRESCEAVAAVFRRAGVDFPEPSALPGLDEYGAQDLISLIAPRLAEEDSDFAPLWRNWQARSGAQDRNRHFQLMFESVMGRWVEGRLSEPGLEPWEEFRLRVVDALQSIREAEGGGRRVVAFTSGGPIGVAVQSCLAAPPRAGIELNWRVRNTSVTTFLYSGSRMSLDGFNELPHLATRADLITFR